MRFYRREGKSISAGSAWTKIASYFNDDFYSKARVIAIGHCWHPNSLWRITRDDGSFYIPEYDFQLGSVGSPFNVDFEVDPRRGIDVYAKNNDTITTIYEAIIVYEGTYDQRPFIGSERCEQFISAYDLSYIKRGYVGIFSSGTLTAASVQSCQLLNPIGSGKLVMLDKATLFIDTGQPFDAQIHDPDVTEANATGTSQKIRTKYIGALASVCTLKNKSTIGVPTGWLAGTFYLGQAANKIPITLSGLSFPIASGKSVWMFMRNNSAGSGASYLILEWFEI